MLGGGGRKKERAKERGFVGNGVLVLFPSSAMEVPIQDKQSKIGDGWMDGCRKRGPPIA